MIAYRLNLIVSIFFLKKHGKASKVARAFA